MDELPGDLLYVIQNLYIPAGVKVTGSPIREEDSRGFEYDACYLMLNGCNVAFRVAKTTKDRPGQFVTTWKRSAVSRNIVPLDKNDVEFIVISVTCQTKNGECYQGQFIFNQKILIEKNIISKNGAGGKLAIRVFPPWSEELVRETILEKQKNSVKIAKTSWMSASAKRTQKWQLKYFLPLKQDGSADLKLVRKYFGFDSQL